MIPDCLENNRFELVFNEMTDGPELKNLPIDDIAMNGIIEEEEMEDEFDIIEDWDEGEGDDVIDSKSIGMDLAYYYPDPDRQGKGSKPKNCNLV